AERLWQKALAFGCALLLGHSVMFGMSRGGMLAMVVTGVIAFLLIPKTWKHYLVLAVTVLIALRLAGAQVRERFVTMFAGSEERDASAESRLQLWAACVQVMQEHPAFGLGPDNWPVFAHKYGFTAGKEAHTLWLQVGAEMGVPGLAFLAGF